jgi:small-conductance mechanosensitive channel
VADDPSTIAWRLAQLETAVRDLGQRVVSKDIHGRDLEEVKRRLAEIERDIAEEKLARKEAIEAERQAREKADQSEKEAREKADKETADRLDKGGANWRQVIFNGVLPALFVLANIILAVLLALRGGGK